MSVEDILRSLTVERYGRAHWWATPPTDHPERPGAVPSFDDSEIACSRRRRAMVEDYDLMFKKASA